MESNQYGEHTRRTVLYRGEISPPLIPSETSSPFFNYGQGFFETILFEDNKLWYFSKHLNRMKKTCSDFNISIDFSQIREEKIYTLLEGNGLKDHCCRVKILYAPIKSAGPWDTLVTAAPYTRPAGDFTLSVHNEIYDSRLNLYKSLNYQYNNYWKEYYKKLNNSDEVLFCNKKQHILEGSYTNLLFVKKSTLYYVGKENNYLHGIMQDRILKAAESINRLKIQSLADGINIQDLKNADEVIICNSLITVQNVKKIFHGKIKYTWKSSPSTDYLAPELRKILIQN